MSLFIGLLAFPDPALQDEVKVGVLAGSLVSALCGAALLSVAKREPPKIVSRPADAVSGERPASGQLSKPK